MDLLAIAWLLCLPPSPDPHDPQALVAFARERERAGAATEAEIILARARHLAPAHPAVTGAPEAPRARPGEPAPAPPPPAPPAIWPAK